MTNDQRDQPLAPGRPPAWEDVESFQEWRLLPALILSFLVLTFGVAFVIDFVDEPYGWFIVAGLLLFVWLFSIFWLVPATRRRRR